MRLPRQRQRTSRPQCRNKSTCLHWFPLTCQCPVDYVDDGATHLEGSPSWQRNTLLRELEILADIQAWSSLWGRCCPCLPGYLLYNILEETLHLLLGGTEMGETNRKSLCDAPCLWPWNGRGGNRRILSLKLAWTYIARLVFRMNKTQSNGKLSPCSGPRGEQNFTALRNVLPMPSPSQLSVLSHRKRASFLRSKRELNDVSKDVFWEGNIQNSKQIHG